MVLGVLLMKLPLIEEEKKILKNIAYQSIEYGLKNQKYLLPKLQILPKNLQQQGASFVTLTRKDLPVHKKLRGCIGTITPKDPIGYDVAKNAYYAAFSDPRFPPLTKEEFPNIEIKISILTPNEKINVKSLQDLLDELNKNIDGLYLKSPKGSATFLPDVWEKVSSKEEFVFELYKKAGLNIQYPFEKIEWFRYKTFSF